MNKTATALIVAFLAISVLPVSDARARNFLDAARLAKVVAINVIVEDLVKDGCLPRPDALKSEAELILRRSGIQVLDDAQRDRETLVLSPLGNVLSGGSDICVVTLEVNLVRYEYLSDESSGLVMRFASTGLNWGPKAGSQERLRTVVNKIVTDLTNEILKARANASSKTQ